ncbi:MAG: threonine-phosphate decarboxylase [Thermoanaerobacteraceae bacterium]|nr:threonine-phosphate decarboxylase [Thermoanaerobacteraceae bacterium]
MQFDSSKLRQHGGNIREVSREYGPKTYLDFSANINPLGLAPAVEQAIRDGISQVVYYPEPDAVTFNHAVAEYLGVDPKYVVSGNGAAELIYLLVRRVNPRRVIIPIPTFSEYQLASEAGNSEIVPVVLRRETRFQWDMEALLQAVPKGDMLFLCNPNNPVGNLLERENLLAVLKACREHGTAVVVDESFRDFVEDMPSALPFVEEFANLTVLYSLTKFFALPGLRLGCAVAQPAVVKELNAMKDCWSVNTLAQIAGCTAVKQTGYIAETRALVAEEREFLYNSLRQIRGLDPYVPSANYIFIDISETGLSSGVLRDKLIERGIIVRDCATYPTLGEDYIRVAVKRREENLLLIDALKHVLEGNDGK